MSGSTERTALAAEYEAEVGYDPFVDDPTATVEEVRATLAEVQQLRAEAEADQMALEG